MHTPSKTNQVAGTTASGPGRTAGCCGGFSLIELLAVVGILGVLAGLGVGFLRATGTPDDVALTIVRDQCRVASLAAVKNGLPVDVLFFPGVDGAPASFRTRVLAPVAYWHFEDGERWLPGLPVVTYRGEVVDGRFGMARRPAVEDGVSGRADPVLEVGLSPDALATFDLSEGFALRVDLFMEGYDGCVVAKIGDALMLELDAGLRPRVEMWMTSGGGQRSGQVEVPGPDAPPIKALSGQRWTTLEVVHDRTTLRLFVDGEEWASSPAKDPLLQTDSDRLVISSPTSPVLGRIDEVRLLAYRIGERGEIPDGVRVILPEGVRRFQFDPLGELERDVPFRVELDDAVDPDEASEPRDYVIRRSGVVEEGTIGARSERGAQGGSAPAGDGERNDSLGAEGRKR